MIEKVAKVRALREAFVEDLGGMYETEEMSVELPAIKDDDKVIIQEDIPDAEIEETYHQNEEPEAKQVDMNELFDY